MTIQYPSQGTLQMPYRHGTTHHYVSDQALSHVPSGETQNYLGLPGGASTDLFEKAPSLEDIRQGVVLGNCYFLSALISIVNNPTGADYLANMISKIQIHGHAKICVRFYFQDVQSKLFIAHYIYMDPTIFVDYGYGAQLFFDRSAMWVHYLQKAYFIFKSIKSIRAFNLAPIQPNGILYQPFQQDIGGGHPSEVYTAIFGEACEHDIFTNPYVYGTTANSPAIYLHEALINRSSNQKLESIIVWHWAKLNLPSASTELNAVNTKDWLQKIYELMTAKQKAAITVTLQAINLFLTPNHLIVQALDISISQAYEFKKWAPKLRNALETTMLGLINAPLTEFICLSILGYLNRCEENYHQKRGTAQYSEEEDRLFVEIVDGFDKNHVLCASTHGETNLRTDTYKSKGILNKHAYAIVGYRIGKVLLPNGTTRILRFLLLANPWGCYTRHYQWKPKPREVVAQHLDGVEKSQVDEYVLSAQEIDEDTWNIHGQIHQTNPSQLNPFVFGALHFTFIMDESIPATTHDGFQGIFAIELSDFFKRYRALSHCKTNKLSPAAISKMPFLPKVQSQPLKPPGAWQRWFSRNSTPVPLRAS